MNQELFPGIPDELFSEIRRISDFIHCHPEPGLQEKEAFRIQKEFLLKHGWSFTSGQASLETAYRAEKIIGDGSGLSVAFFSEYDALDGLGHGCGHNLICSTGLASAEIMARDMAERNRSGRVILYGTPGEEGKGGKVRMADSGCFRDADLALTSHPSSSMFGDSGALSVSRYTVIYHGKAAHAAGAPELGVNALDAVISLFNGVALWRQQMPESARVHGIIRRGGEAANIIPDETEAFFYVRALTEKDRVAMNERFLKIAEAAAMMTGCTVEIIPGIPYRSGLVIPALNKAFAETMAGYGVHEKAPAGNEARVSTDFANVAQLVPGANLHYRICEPGTPLHSAAFRDFAGGDQAFICAMNCARVLADIGLRFMEDPEFRTSVLMDFKAAHAASR